jgi:MFS family permease
VPMRWGKLWRHPDFLKLWAGETISLLGSQVTYVALPLIAAVTLDASPLEMGLLSAMGTLPILLLSLPAGAWLDRRRRRPILLLTNLGRTLLLAIIPVAAWLDLLTMPLLYLVVLLIGVLSVLFDIAYQAFLPSLVQRQALLEGNSKLEISRSIAQVAGPSAGGLLVTLLSAPFAVALDALSFVVSAICIALIRQPEPLQSQGSQRRQIWRDIREGLAFVVRQPMLRSIVLVTGLGNLAGGGIFALHILLMTETLKLSPMMIGALLSLGGPSALLGALAVGRVAQPLGVGRTIVVGSLLFTIGDFCLALAAGPYWLTLALLALSQLLIGVGSTLYNVTVISLRQAITPDHLLGRVVASARMVAVGTQPVGALIGGVLGNAIGLRAAIFAGACGMLLPLVWLLFTPVSTLREQPASVVVDEAVA